MNIDNILIAVPMLDHVDSFLLHSLHWDIIWTQIDTNYRERERERDKPETKKGKN